MTAILVAAGVTLAVGAPATAAGGVTAVSSTETVFDLGGGVTATATLSPGQRRGFGAPLTLAAMGGTPAMFAPGVDVTSTPAVGLSSSANCGASSTCDPGTMTIDFSVPVDDPTISIAEFGAGSGDLRYADGFRVASTVPAALATNVSTGATFTRAPGGYLRGDANIACGASRLPGGCGSVTVDGKAVTRIVLDFARFALTAGQTGGTDGYAFAITARPATPALTIAKTVDAASARPGDRLGYSLVIANTGSVDARDVPVADELPAGLRGVTADAGGTVAGGTVRWTVPSVPAGGSTTLHVSGVVAADAATGVLTNRAVVANPAGAPAGTPSPVAKTPCPDVPTKACAVTTIAAQFPVLSIAKATDHATAAQGEAIGYEIVVANSGTAAARDVPVVDHLPDGLTTARAGEEGTVTGREVRWTVAEIPAGGSVRLHVGGVAATRQDAFTLVNRATVANPAGVHPETPAPASLTPCAGGEPGACASTTVSAGALLELHKTVDKASARPGDLLDYAITVRNVGRGAAVNVPVVDRLPAGTLFVSSTAGGISAGSRSAWLLERLDPGAEKTMHVRVRVTADAADTIENRAGIAVDPALEATLRAAAERAGISTGDVDPSELPLPAVRALAACADDAGWSCARTSILPGPGLAETGINDRMPLLLGGGAAAVLLFGVAALAATAARRRRRAGDDASAPVRSTHRGL